MKLRRTVLSLAVVVLAVPALASATSVQRNFPGPFMQAGAQVRCQLSPTLAQCVSMQTGRVAIIRSNGAVTTLPNLRRHLGRNCAPGRQSTLCARQPDGLHHRQRRRGVRVRADALQFRDERVVPPAKAVWDRGRLHRRLAGSGADSVRLRPSGDRQPLQLDHPRLQRSRRHVWLDQHRYRPARIYYVSPYTRQDGTYVSGYYRSCSRC